MFVYFSTNIEYFVTASFVQVVLRTTLKSFHQTYETEYENVIKLRNKKIIDRKPLTICKSYVDVMDQKQEMP